ncbi:MAG: S-methyl-5'-thioinosine phosphorylase [bacterium]
MPRIGVFVGSSPLPMTGESLSLNLQTPWGDASAPPQKYVVGDYEYLILSRHGAQHEFAPHQINYRANIWLMHSLGVDGLLGTYTVGSIDPALAVGQLVVPSQLIDYSWGRASTFDDKLHHIEFTQPYDTLLRQQVLQADGALVDGGVYACTQGPRLETAAEIKRLAQDGATLVGMTGMPEAALARELDIPFAALCLVVNPAAGVSDDVIDMQALAEISATGGARMLDVLIQLAA